MKSKLVYLSLFLTLLITYNSNSNNYITFSGKNAVRGSYVPLDSVKILNNTQNKSVIIKGKDSIDFNDVFTGINSTYTQNDDFYIKPKLFFRK